MEGTTMSKPSQSDDLHARIDLRESHALKRDQAKVHGARWDRDNQTWYAPPGTDLRSLKWWLPQGVLEEMPDPAPAKTAEKGISLTELLGKVS